MANPAGPFGHWNVKRPAFVCCVGRLRVDCRHQTTKAQWPLQNHKRPARTVAAEAESQRPDLTESSRSDSSGHWQRSTHTCPTSCSKAAVAANAEFPSFAATNRPLGNSCFRPTAAIRCFRKAAIGTAAVLRNLPRPIHRTRLIRSLECKRRSVGNVSVTCRQIFAEHFLSFSLAYP